MENKIKKPSVIKDMIDELFNSKSFVIVIFIIASLILLLFSFKLGVFVGSEKAKFSYKWNDNYRENFSGMKNDKNGPMMPFPGDRIGDIPMMNSRGLSGNIVKIDSGSITIQDKDKTEKIITISDKTSIKKFREDIKITDLKVDDEIVVLGEPDDTGAIEAKLIRVFSKEEINMNNNLSKPLDINK